MAQKEIEKNRRFRRLWFIKNKSQKKELYFSAKLFSVSFFSIFLIFLCFFDWPLILQIIELIKKEPNRGTALVYLNLPYLFIETLNEKSEKILSNSINFLKVFFEEKQLFAKLKVIDESNMTHFAFWKYKNTSRKLNIGNVKNRVLKESKQFMKHVQCVLLQSLFILSCLVSLQIK